MKLVHDVVKGLCIDTFLQYPIIFSTVITCFTVFLPLSTLIEVGWERITVYFAIFELLAIFIAINQIPTLSTTGDRVVLHPTASCSAYDNRVHYLSLTLTDQHQSVYELCTNDTNENIKNATKYYIISSWISSPGDYITIESVQFQPENETPYTLPKGRIVRPVGPSEEDRQKVEFTFISRTGGKKVESGYINLNSLASIQSGWYCVSNRKCELTRWWRDCTLGYVNSHFVQLPTYTRSLLFQDNM